MATCPLSTSSSPSTQSCSTRTRPSSRSYSNRYSSTLIRGCTRIDGRSTISGRTQTQRATIAETTSRCRSKRQETCSGASLWPLFRRACLLSVPRSSGRMALAYFQLTADKPWVEKHYEVFKSWTTFLTDDGLVPAEQLSTDDFAGASRCCTAPDLLSGSADVSGTLAGTLSNQTNLAVKAIVGIGERGFPPLSPYPLISIRSQAR